MSFTTRILIQVQSFLPYQRPPSQSLNSYSTGPDDARSPAGSTGTPGPISQQPSSQLSTDNNSEAGEFHDFLFFSITFSVYLDYIIILWLNFRLKNA